MDQVRITHIGRKDFRALLARTISGTDGYRQLRRAAVAAARSRLGAVLAGESTPEVREVLDRFRASLIERAIRIGPEVTAAEAEAFMDAFDAVRAKQLALDAGATATLEWLVAQTLKETETRLMRHIAGTGDALLCDASDVEEKLEKDRRRRKGGGQIIFIDDNGDDPRVTPPPQAFGELGVLVTEWKISETVRSLHCAQETPGPGADDIIFQGTWRLNTSHGKLNITSAEIDYNQGDTHWYDSAPQPTPHTPRLKIAPDNPLSLYFSTHVLTESDGWTEIAAAIAALLEEAISQPLRTLAGPLAGAFAGGVPGAGAVAGLGGAAADALLDSASGDLLSEVGAEVGRYFRDLIAGIGAEDNIVFEPWNTAVLIRWVVDPASGETVPRWTVHHSVPGRFQRLASPEAENPRTGAGTLSPSRFAGMDEVYVAPANYSRAEYPVMTGRYLYISYISVDRVQATI